MSPKKRKSSGDGRVDNAATLAAAARRSREAHRKRHPDEPLTANDELADKILAAMESGAPLPSPKLARGADFEDVEDEVCFGEECGIEFIDKMRTTRMQATAKGRAALQAISKCKECDEDICHWGEEQGELLDAIVNDECPPRIEVVRAVNPFNPVALLTPPTEAALCAVAAEIIQLGEPIALYLGDLCLADDENVGAHNTYLYEISPDELRLRGFKHGANLRVDASKCGGEARFINDKFAPGGLPAREPNCFVELVFDGDNKEFVLVVFASKRIRKGDEIIIDYGPDYWQVASEALLRGHAAAQERQAAPSGASSQKKGGPAGSSTKKKQRKGK